MFKRRDILRVSAILLIRRGNSINRPFFGHRHFLPVIFYPVTSTFPTSDAAAPRIALADHQLLSYFPHSLLSPSTTTFSIDRTEREAIQWSRWHRYYQAYCRWQQTLSLRPTKQVQNSKASLSASSLTPAALPLLPIPSHHPPRRLVKPLHTHEHRHHASHIYRNHTQPRLPIIVVHNLDTDATPLLLLPHLPTLLHQHIPILPRPRPHHLHFDQPAYPSHPHHHKQKQKKPCQCSPM